MTRQLPIKTIGELCEFESGNGFRPQDWKRSGLPIIRIQNLNGSNTFNYFDGTPDPSWIVEPGDLLFAWAGVKGVSFGPTIWSGPQGVLNQHIYRIRPTPGVHKQWLYFALSEITFEIESKAHGFKTSLVHVRKADITGARVAAPAVREQEAIAATLTLWDTALETTERLLAAKEQSHVGLLQALLRREGVPERKLSDLAARIVRKNTTGNNLPLTISGKDGLVAQSTFFGKRIAAETTEHYTLLKRGEFAYNKSYSAGYPFGAIKRLENHDEGIVSSLYICFALRTADDLLSDYLTHFCEAGGFNRQIRMIAQEGARNHGLLNVATEDFFAMKMHLPDRAHQQRVVSAMADSTRGIVILRRSLDAMRRQRRAVMHKLLTGKWRVPVDEGVTA